MEIAAVWPYAEIDFGRRCFVGLTLVGWLGTMRSVSAQGLGNGEWFTVNIAGYMSQPKLIEGQLIASGESSVPPIHRVGNSFSYSSQDNLKVPEAFTFRWRAETDTRTEERVFLVRSQLPQDVVAKVVSRSSPPYVLKLDFRVRHGIPDIKWGLFRLDHGASRRAGGSGGGDLISEGAISLEPPGKS